jgi:dynein heavy chain
VVNYDKLVECLHDYVEEYNVNFPMQSLSIVLFDHCIEQLLKICRCLRTTMSHTLLVGVSGSGKQTLTRLSCFISHCHFKTVQSKNRITLNDFRQSIKDALILAGVKRQRVAFITTEYHMNAAAV